MNFPGRPIARTSPRRGVVTATIVMAMPLPVAAATPCATATATTRATRGGSGPRAFARDRSRRAIAPSSSLVLRVTRRSATAAAAAANGDAAPRRVDIYDTTLRDGSQQARPTNPPPAAANERTRPHRLRRRVDSNPWHRIRVARIPNRTNDRRTHALTPNPPPRARERSRSGSR